MRIKFNPFYFLIFLVLLIIEVLIAIYLKTGFIRHTVGDFLVTILIFSFIKSFIQPNSLKLGILVLVFAFTVEILQLFNLVGFLEIKNTILKISLGTTFHLSDLLAHTLGIVITLIIEFKLNNYELY